MELSMNRVLGFIIVILSFLPIIIFFMMPTSTPIYVDLNINNHDKEILMDYSYSYLDSYFNGNNTTFENYDNLDNKKISYNILFVTLLKDGKVRGCQSGSTPINDNNRIFLDIDEAIAESINDDRFGGIITEDEYESIEIMFTFLYNISYLNNKSYGFLQNTIELGIHSIELNYNNTPIVFKESVPISNNYDFAYLMKRLCLKGNLDEACYLEDDVDIFIYDTFSFKAKREKPIIDLYRYSILIDLDTITNDMILDSIISGQQWYLNSIDNTTNLSEYIYYPSDDTYSFDNNHVRQLASLWALTELQKFYHKDSLDVLINTTFHYYLDFIKNEGDYSYLLIDDSAKLANNAFIILSLLNVPSFNEQETLLEKFAEGIMSLQNENGSYNTYFFSEKNTGIDFYPGEAMLSLMKLYRYNKNETLLQSVQKGFYHYRDYWINNKNTAFIPWHTQTYALLFEETKDMQVAEFIFEMNDWVIDNYQVKESSYLDEIGGFPRYYPTFSTSVYLEGINDAYNVAIQVNDTFHIQKYKESIIQGSRFILQIQITEENSFYMENKNRSIGGYKKSLTSNEIRVDNVQHSVLALMKTYENNIFN